MSAFYERGGIVIHLGDCREVLPTLTGGSADLMVTDPPYGAGYTAHRETVAGFGAIAGDGDASWVPGAVALACGPLRDKRHAYVFGPRELVGPPLVAQVELVWDKCMLGMGDWTSPWSPSHEPITFAVNTRERGGGAGAARLRQGSILSYPRPRAVRHPTEKPVALLRRLIESSSRVGETVLDPFVGCGSTLVAAVAEGRLGIGIELDERYAETAAKRVDAALDHAKAGEAVFT